MSLITPDFGLLFWMTLIFGIVFFILAKLEIEARMASWKVEQAQMLEATRKEQSQMLREATETKARIVADAKAQAQAEADKILEEAKLQIAAEKESALRDVRKEVALLSVQVAEKVLRHELSDDGNQRAFIDELVDEASKAQMHS